MSEAPIFRPGQCALDGTLIYTTRPRIVGGKPEHEAVTSAASFSKARLPLRDLYPAFGCRPPPWMGNGELLRVSRSRFTDTGIRSYLLSFDSINGKQLVRDVLQFVRGFARLDDEAEALVAVYVVLTYCFALFESIPYLRAVLSSGDDARLSRALSAIVFNGRLASEMTVAAMTTELRWTATTLIVDRVKRDDDGWSPLLQPFNYRDATFSRMTPAGLIEESAFYAPRIFVGEQRQAHRRVADCTIPVTARQPSHGDALTMRGLRARAQRLRDQLHRFCLEQADHIATTYAELEADVSLSAEFIDRFGSLLAVAKVIDEQQDGLDAYDGRALDLGSKLMVLAQRDVHQRGEDSLLTNEPYLLATLIHEFIKNEPPLEKSSSGAWYVAALFTEYTNASGFFERQISTKALGERLNRWNLVASRKLITIRDGRTLRRMKRLGGGAKRRGYIFDTQRAKKILNTRENNL